MKAKEPRIARSYKSTEKVYKDAQKRASKTKKKLAQHVEEFVTKFAKGDIYDYSAE